jgi:hypothetical protein
MPCRLVNWPSCPPWLLSSHRVDISTSLMLILAPTGIVHSVLHADGVLLLAQANDIQVLAAKGGSTKTKLLPYEQDPRRAKQRRAFQALDWLEVLGPAGSNSNPADLWQQFVSAAAESEQPLRLTTLSVLFLHDLPDAVQRLAHLVRCRNRTDSWPNSPTP